MDNGFLDYVSEGIENMILSSAENADRVIEAFKDFIDLGYNPELIQFEIYRQLPFNVEDLLDEDKERIQREVENYYLEKEGF